MKILVLICSCNTEKSRKLRETCRETWLRYSDPDIHHVFVVAGENSEIDVMSVDGEDTYAALPGKMKRAYSEILENYDFDYVFKCDDDTYVCFDRLKSIIGGDFGGNEFLMDTGKFASGGAGYFIRREILSEIVKDDIPETGAEDVIFSKLAQKYSKIITVTKLLGYSHTILPSPENDQISAHWLSPLKMGYIFNTFKGDNVKTATVQHIHWEGDLEFAVDYFRRVSTGDFGKWRLEDDELHLEWENWSPEIVFRKNDKTFSCDTLTITFTDPI